MNKELFRKGVPCEVFNMTYFVNCSLSPVVKQAVVHIAPQKAATDILKSGHLRPSPASSPHDGPLYEHADDGAPECAFLSVYPRSWFPTIPLVSQVSTHLEPGEIGSGLVFPLHALISHLDSLASIEKSSQRSRRMRAFWMESSLPRNGAVFERRARTVLLLAYRREDVQFGEKHGVEVDLHHENGSLLVRHETFGGKL